MKAIERMARSRKSAAFTLLELVIAVGIVVVLVAIISPAFRAARASAQTAQCIQNLKHIYVSTLAFVEDHNGLLPPDLGQPDAAVIHPRFNVNQYWWDAAYLGRYVLNDPNRRRDSVGKIKESEMGAYRCPARMIDGPDSAWSDHPVTYVMQKLFTNKPRNYQFRNMENKSEKLFLAEGRQSTLVVQNAKTGKNGDIDSGKRLRRYHGNEMNILFFDGRVLQFAGLDEEIVPWIKSGDY